MKSKNVLILTLVFMTGIAAIGITAEALPQYLDAYNTTFNTNAGCGICHVNPVDGGPRTAYGIMFENQTKHASDPSSALTTIGQAPVTTPAPNVQPTYNQPTYNQPTYNQPTTNPTANQPVDNPISNPTYNTGLQYDNINVKHDIKLCDDVSTNDGKRISYIKSCGNTIINVADPFEIATADVNIEPGRFKEGEVDMYWYDANNNNLLYSYQASKDVLSNNIYVYSFIPIINKAGNYYVLIKSTWGDERINFKVENSSLSNAPTYNQPTYNQPTENQPTENPTPVNTPPELVGKNGFRVRAGCGILPMYTPNYRNNDYNYVKSVKDLHEKEIMSRPGVVGVGVTDGKTTGLGYDYEIVVMLKDSSYVNNVPCNLDGVQVVYQVTGEFRTNDPVVSSPSVTLTPTTPMYTPEVNPTANPTPIQTNKDPGCWNSYVGFGMCVGERAAETGIGILAGFGKVIDNMIHKL